MAVALRGYTQGTTQSSGSVSIAWPAGTASGDLAVLVAQDHSTNGPQVSGWTAIGRGVWYKRVTSSDIASPLPVKGKTTFLQTFTGADRIGSWRNNEGLTLTKAGAALFVDGWGPSRVSTVDPGSTDRLGNQIRLVTDNTPNAVWFRTATTTGYKALQDHDDDCSYVSYEILPTAGPNAPTLNTPASGAYVDNGSPIVFSWIHQSNSGATQEAAQVRIRQTGTGTWYYLKSDGTLTTTVTTLTQAANSATLNSSVLSTGVGTYDFQVATQDFGVLGPFSSTRVFTPVIPPVVNSITVTSTFGSLTPTIAWTRTANLGSPEAWQVRIAASTDSTPDNPIWDSGVTSGSATATLAPALTDWVNAQPLYAWVRVAQTGGLWSPWTKDDATFTVSWTPPAAPATITPANVADGPVQVTVAGIPVGYSSYLEMSYDGQSWTPVQADYENLAAVLTNYVANPSAETNTTSWAATGGSVVSTGSNAQMIQSGTKQFLFTADGTASVGSLEMTSATYRAPVTAGQWVGFKTFVATESSNHQTRIQIAWRDGAGAGLGFVASAWTATPFYTGGTPELIAQAPAGAVSVAYYVQMRDGNNTSGNIVSGKRMWTDGLRLHVADTQDEVTAILAIPYWDGATADTADYDYAWSGTAHLSNSTRTDLRTSSTFQVPLAAYGQAAYYRARTSNVISGVTMYSDWLVSEPLASTDRNAYFVDDSNTFLQINIREEQPINLVQGVTVTYGHGADKPRQDQTVPQGMTGTLTLYSETILEEYELREWLTEKGTWTTRWVPEGNPGLGTLFRLNTRMALAKASTVQHVMQKAHSGRFITFDWVEQ